MQMLRDDLYRPWFANDQDWGFEIIDGEYSGVTIQVEEIAFSEEEDTGVKLNFHVISKPETFNDDEVESDLFNSTVELIINDILREAINFYEQDRTDDTSESSSQ